MEKIKIGTVNNVFVLKTSLTLMEIVFNVVKIQFIMEKIVFANLATLEIEKDVKNVIKVVKNAMEKNLTNVLHAQINLN